MHAYDVWRDRAVFHFLTTPEARAAYVSNMRRSIKPGGHVVIATFGPEWPERCSGVPVCRYDATTLSTELGDDVVLAESLFDVHHTCQNADGPSVPNGSSAAVHLASWHRDAADVPDALCRIRRGRNSSVRYGRFAVPVSTGIPADYSRKPWQLSESRRIVPDRYEGWSPIGACQFRHS
jgi:hypothetical protein